MRTTPWSEWVPMYNRSDPTSRKGEDQAHGIHFDSLSMFHWEKVKRPLQYLLSLVVHAIMYFLRPEKKWRFFLKNNNATPLNETKYSD